jgi:galactokinase
MTEAVLLQQLRQEFAVRFGVSRSFSAPGRINLIGEHTDYNEGLVLPIAIDRRTYVVGAKRTDRHVSVRSSNSSGEFTFDLDHPGRPRRSSWIDYVEGTAQAMLKRDIAISGANLQIASDIPIGAGLSSSAALEISVAFALARLGGASEPDGLELALCGQAAENDYVGARVGIMDQLITMLAQEGTALLIDCRTLERTAVPLNLGSAQILICNTRVKHQLASSAYNERREQCERGVQLIRARLPSIRSLRDVSQAQFDASAAGLPEPIRRRCRHVIGENERVLRTSRALGRGHLEEIGELMVQSHRSLRDDYEVSCAELDAAVEAAIAEPGVYGARMTGGGFGGCTITLLEQAAVDRVSAAVRARLRRQFSIEPELFVSSACSGAREHEAHG